MITHFSWTETIQNFGRDVWSVAGAFLLMLLGGIGSVLLCTSLLAAATSFFKLPIVVGGLVFWMLAVMPAMIVIVWLGYGFHRFLLSLVKTGRANYSLLFSATRWQVLSLVGLMILIVIPTTLLSWATQFFSAMEGYRWAVALCVLLQICIASRFLFSLYAVVSGFGPISAIQRSISFAGKQNRTALLLAIIANLTLFLNVLGINPINLPLAWIAVGFSVTILLMWFVNYAAAVLYTMLDADSMSAASASNDLPKSV